MNDRICKTCVHWERLEGYEEGFCHRFPPTTERIGEDPNFPNDSFWAHPCTEANDWCGEWDGDL